MGAKIVKKASTGFDENIRFVDGVAYVSTGSGAMYSDKWSGGVIGGSVFQMSGYKNRFFAVVGGKQAEEETTFEQAALKAQEMVRDQYLSAKRTVEEYEVARAIADGNIDAGLSEKKPEPKPDRLDRIEAILEKLLEARDAG